MDEAPDIYAFWAHCRAEQPVVAVDGPDGRPLWFVTRYDDVQSVLHDAARFSSAVNAETMGPVMGEVILAMDGDEHRRYRDIVGRAFRPSALERWEDELIAPLAHHLLDALSAEGRADLVEDFTRSYPVQVIAGIMGVPVEDHALFDQWAHDISLGPQDYDRSIPASRAMRRYLEPIVASRRAEPCGDLVSDIVTTEIDGVALGDEHVYGFLRLLLPAGADTTFRAMGSVLLALLLHPHLLERARDDEAFRREVIEETLRWETSVTMVNRLATEDVELGGVTIPAGSSVVCALGSANHDESRYERGADWAPGRDGPGHIAFGTGRHQCLGMHLARLELRVAVGAVLERLPGLRLDPDAGPVRVEGLAFRGPERLPVVFDTR
ncbi:MAG: cytochrome P450 [Acidimicrobiales bacterium]